MSQSEDAYAPEEPTPDIPMSLLDIQMPETPDSTKGQTSDGDTSRLESPKVLKPVLGKLKAKKRLMAFANKFNVPSKIQNKSNLLQAHSTKISKSKSTSSDNGKSSKNDSVVNVNSDSVQYHNRHSSGSKSKKKTEEKILAIEEIRREESKSKMLLAEAMAAASLEEETYANRNGQNLLESEKIVRERNRQDDVNVSYKSASKSTIENKYSGRRRYGREERKDNTNRESKDYNSSKERYYKVSRNKEQHRKDKGRKVDKDKREDSNKYEENRDRRDEERDKKNSDKWEDVREKKGIKEKRESFKEKRNDSQEKISEIKERKEKERDKGKERDIMNSSSWVELKKCGITIDDIIETRRYDHSERTTKNRTAEDYLRHFEQMLMMNDCRLKRYAFIAEGLEGPKEYPPESIRVTKRGRPQLFYSENPRMSLFMNHQQILQTVTIDHREKMRNICEGDYIRNDIEETEKPQHIRNWYPKTGICKSGENTKWHVPINVQLPRSKWDSEDEDKLSDTEKQPENEAILSNIVSEQEPEEFSPRLNTIEEDINKDKGIINEDETSSIKKIDDNRQPSPLLQSAGNEKLASEYEQFMKMVCNDIPISKEFSPKVNKPASTLSYHEFNIETNSPNDNNFSFVEHNISGKLDESESSNKIEEKFKANENRQNLEKVSKVEDDQVSSSSSHIQAQKSVTADSKTMRDKTESEDSKSIPSDWENVRIKVERMSDENSDSVETRKKKRRKKTTSSSSESSSSSSSSDSEEETRKKRKRKISNDSDSLSDSDTSSDTSTSSSDSSSSGDKRKKRKKKKRKAEKRKKKAKRIAKTKKKRRRKISSNSSSSDSSQDRKKKRIVTKKSKQKKKSSNKQDNREDIVKTIQKSPLELSSLENAKLIRSQVPLKKIKEEAKIENRKRITTDKHDVWSKEQDMVRKVISDSDIRSKTHKDEEKRNKVEERYLEEWEMDPVIIPQKGEKLSKSNVEKVENPNVENIRKIEGKDERTKKDDKSKHDEHFKEKCSSISKEIIPGNLKIEEDIDGKKKRKRDKEKKSSSEFLAEWEKESERISQQIMQDEMKLSKKLDKQKNEKWGETEFDTLNVPSLTQLEREVSSRQLLADEWEVDSLEAVPDLMINRKKTSRTSKKLEKEVRYDKKTDMYITIEKETLKECKKRQDRLSAMRIWEEEQEEGEKEAMLLLEQKNKRKRDDWDIEEESFLREKSDRKESTEDNIAMIDSIHTEVNIVNKNVDTSMKHDVIARKKSKKSRWDMASQSEEKIEFKAPVMWEEECTEWTKGNKFDHNIERVSLEHCDSILSNTMIRDENVCMIEQQLRKSTTKNSTSSDIIDLFPRKSQDIDLLESSWTAEEHARSKSRRSLNPQEDVFFDKTKELTPSKEQLKDIFEMDMKLTKKNTELYSPSSPAGSQKSEDMEVFKSNHTNSLNLEDNFLRDKPKNETVVKSDDESVPNIPLQIKYCDGKYAKSAIKEEFEEILGVKKTEDQTLRTKFDMKASENSPERSIKEPYTDMNYKSLRMDIFTGYESDELRGQLINKSSETVSSSASAKGTEETNEGKAALKLIPKQLLVRRNNERVKTKLISDDPMQHAAALLTIQKKLRESHAVKNDIKDASCEEPAAAFKIECEKTTSIHTPAAAEVIPTEQTTITDVKVDSKDLSITVKTSITTKSESPGAVKLDFNEYSSGNKAAKLEELKKSRPRNSKDISDIECRIRSPGGEQKKKSPSRKENREDKRISDRNKEKRDKKFDERERGDRRDNRALKLEYNESRRRSSPSGSRSKKSISWEREGSHSESYSRSWSRSRSKSPKRKDELFASSSKEKRSSRIDEDRCGRSRIDDRRERPVRSPHRSGIPYNKDHFKKHGTTKGDRDEWNRRKYDFMEREKESRSYEPIEVLRERNVDFDKHRESRFREDEAERLLWPYEAENMLQDGNESLDSYPNSQDLDLDYEEKSYYRDDNIERDIMEGPFRPSSKFKHRKSRPAAKRNRQWEKEREPLDLDRHGHVRRTEKLLPSRGRSPPRPRRSPHRSSHERFRHESRSRSRSWSRSGSRSGSGSRSKSKSRSRSRSRSTSRSRSMMRSRSGSRPRSRSRSRSTSRSRSMMRSRSRSRSGSRSRTRSTSGSRMRTPDHFRMTKRSRSSRSPSMGRGRISESSRERKDEHDSMKLDSYIERGRRIETIVQSVSGLSRDSAVLDSEMHIGDNMETIAAGFQYSAENEVGNEYYYTENNLTYPPCIDDSTASSPKRLSLDDRLELELGIKKQQDGTAVSNDYGESFNSNVCYPSSPQQQQQQLLYRQQPTVLQVGNVLQVVPADFNGVPATHREPSNSSSTPIVRGSSQVVRVGNVLQVVPTSLDWSGGQPSSVDQSGMIYSTTVPQSSPVSSVPMSVPVPVPVPMPVPAVPSAVNSSTPVSTLSPLPLSVPVPVPGPVPLPVTQTTFSRTEVTPQRVPVLPVYNYEVILETRRKEREERKRLREIKRKEKERRRIERINRRALQLLEKNNMRQSESTNQQKSSALDPSVLKALRESEEQCDVEEKQTSTTVFEKEEEMTPVAASSAPTEEEEVPVEEDEEEEEEEEAEVEDDEEEEEEAEDDEEEEEEDDEKSRLNKSKNDADEATATTPMDEMNKIQIETESKGWPELLPPPLKGILVASGFRRTSVPNGNLDDLSTPENDSGDNTDKEGTEVDKNESNKDETGENKPSKLKIQTKKTKLAKQSKRKQRSKKSVQFADGIKPGEGTSPSGGEGDMPSPPPPISVARSAVRDVRRSSSRKSRKQEKRTRPPKAKKKVKVKIIKLKKPRVTPLTAMMMDDSDELDDRSPPPPPPGSPPPPHLWPSYLSTYNAINRTSEAQSTATVSSTVQGVPPPPTPLPLLVPPPPLNYTIQPCSKA